MGQAGLAIADTPAPVARLRLMGIFRARLDTQALFFPGGTRRVLAYLALNGVTSRAALAGALWPEQTQARAMSNLRTVLWRLQRISKDFIECTDDLIALHETVSVDLEKIDNWAKEAISPTVASLLEVTEPPTGTGLELLPGWDEPWLEAPRTRMRILQTQAYECVATRLLSAGRVPEALPYALHVQQAEPLRESAQQLMLEIHLRQGNIAEALRQYEHYRAVLRDELGLTPGLRITTLMGQYVTQTQAPTPRRTRDRQ